jgi:hypothetical protein
MRASEALDAALGAGDGTGRIVVTGDDGAAEIDAVAIGPIGVRVRAVRIDRGVDVDIALEAAALPDRVRTLPDRVVPVEVDPGLGGAILRSHPDDMREQEFWELDVRRRSTTVRKQRVRPDGQREGVDFTLTREQLGRLVDEVR